MIRMRSFRYHPKQPLDDIAITLILRQILRNYSVCAVNDSVCITTLHTKIPVFDLPIVHMTCILRMNILEFVISHRVSQCTAHRVQKSGFVCARRQSVRARARRR